MRGRERPSWESGRSNKLAEKRETNAFEQMRSVLAKGFSSFLSNLRSDTRATPDALFTLAERKMLTETGIDMEQLHMGTVQITGLHETATLRLPAHKQASEAKQPHRASSPEYSVTLAGLLLVGCGGTKSETVSADIPKVSVTGDRYLSDGAFGPAEQPAPVPPEGHGGPSLDSPLTPEHSPTGQGVQQWVGSAEHNPDAVAWLAIKNTGLQPCTVDVTRLEISYVLYGDPVLGSTQINGVQILADGSETKSWGTFLTQIQPGSSFTLPPNTPDYVHPFGPVVKIPDGATQVTVSFSGEITEGCIVQVGMDTYTKENPMTGHQIQEAVKAPWVNKSIPEESPLSYAIVHGKKPL